MFTLCNCVLIYTFKVDMEYFEINLNYDIKRPSVPTNVRLPNTL